MGKVNGLSMDKDAIIRGLLDALKPFANAYARMRYYECNVDCLRIEAGTGDGGSYELFADENEAHGKEPSQFLELGHLANAEQLYEAYSDGE